MARITMLLEALLAHREKKHATAEADHFKNFTEERQRASETSRRHQSTTVFPALHRIIAISERPATALPPLHVVVNL
jgi:hypothetical protein